MGEEIFDAIVVGGGVGGLAAGYKLAKEGFNVLVIERGEKPGSKNVVGGRLYTHSIKKLFPNFPEGAKVERPVTKEVVGLLYGDSSLIIEFSDPSLRGNSYTVLRARFDEWLGSQTEKAGAILVTGIRVDDLIIEDGFVKGVIAGEDRVYSNVVIAADGAISMIAEKAGLRKPYKPEDMMLGIKEVVKLDKHVIEERFGLKGDEEGAAHLYIGDITMGASGGGFLYTNKDTVSIGLVIKLSSAIRTVEENPMLYSYELINRFTSHPHIFKYLKGGEVVEYSAHLIPEPRPEAMPKLYGNGILVVGDAAGLIISTPYTLRGMDLAIESGIAAAETVKLAHEKGVFDAHTLSYYERLLEKRVLVEVKRFMRSREFMSNPRLYREYPEILVGLFRRLIEVGDETKDKVWPTLRSEMRGKVSILTAIRDIISALRAF